MRLKLLAISALSGLLLAGCKYETLPDPSLSSRDTEYLALAAKWETPQHLERFRVDYATDEKPGTIVIDTKEKYLYLVEAGGKAIRYGVATGAEAYGWTGTATIKRKVEWPQWMPPEEMMRRWPEFGVYRSHGPLAGGPDNPLGARALYLYDDKGRDTLYRIHGTNEPEKIGRAVSSGCIRLRNIDVVDLYSRVGMNTKVIVR